jgi:hypothetical protein
MVPGAGFEPLTLGVLVKCSTVMPLGQIRFSYSNQGILKGKYHCTVDLLFDWFRLVCFANKKQKLSVVIQLIPNQSNRRSMVQ